MGTFTRLNKRLKAVRNETDEIMHDLDRLREVIKSERAVMTITTEDKLPKQHHRLTKQNIDFLIESVELQPHNIYEFFNGEVVINKLREMLRWKKNLKSYGK